MSQAAETVDPNTVVSVEQDGRVLSGVGVTEESLAETMERHAPEPTTEPKAAEPAQLSKGRKRYQELTAERDEAKRVADVAMAAKDAAEAKARELEAKLATPSVPSTPAPAAVALPAIPAEPGAKPKLADFTAKIGQPSGYANWEDANDAYNDAREEYLVSKTLEPKVRGAIEHTQQARTFHDQAMQTIDRGRKAYADFDQVKATGAGATVLLPPDRLLAIVQHPQSEHVQYALMKDATLAQKAASCHPFEFGAFLATLVPAPEPKTPAPTPAPPAPYTPVGSGSKTVVTKSSDLVNGYDYDSSGYRSKRASELGRKSRYGQ